MLFVREAAEERVLVALNFGSARFPILGNRLQGCVLLSTGHNRRGEIIKDEIVLNPNEGLLIELMGDAEIPAFVG